MKTKLEWMQYLSGLTRIQIMLIAHSELPSWQERVIFERDSENYKDLKDLVEFTARVLSCPPKSVRPPSIELTLKKAIETPAPVISYDIPVEFDDEEPTRPMSKSIPTIMLSDKEQDELVLQGKAQLELLDLPLPPKKAPQPIPTEFNSEKRPVWHTKLDCEPEYPFGKPSVTHSETPKISKLRLKK